MSNCLRHLNGVDDFVDGSHIKLTRTIDFERDSKSLTACDTRLSVDYETTS